MGWHDRTGCGGNVTQQKNLCSCLSVMFSHACRGVGQHIAKKSTFTDLIACPEHLIEKKPYERKALHQLGSAGGLLMGAVLNTLSVRI
jgi:hypothetical protein